VIVRGRVLKSRRTGPTGPVEVRASVQRQPRILARMPKPEVGDRAPDHAVLDAGGREVMLSSFWRERPVVAAFLRHYG